MNMSELRMMTYRYMGDLIKEYLKPKEDLTLSEWADKYIILPQNTPVPGKWRTDRTPYLKDIMNCITDDYVNYVVTMTCNQIGKGAVINNAICYYIHQKPVPMLMVQPTFEAAEDYSRTKLGPIFEACKEVREKLSGITQKVRKKIFPGGFLQVVGANSPVGLASNTVKNAFLDEVDRYPPGAGKEGDQIELATKRTDTYGTNRKIVITSTPGLEETSKVYDWYKKSSKEVWHIPCPSCSEYTNPTIEDFDYKNLLLACKKCGSLHDEYEWKSVQKNGKYIAENPNEKRIRGFHINVFSSPWVPWRDVGFEYEQALNDPLKMTTFVNTRLGLPWKGIMLADNKYKDIYEKNRADYEAQLHEEILVLTAGVDIQKWGRVVEVVGYGKNGRSFGVEYKVFPGEPSNPDTWDKFDEYLDKRFYFKDGRSLKIQMTFIDTGGHYTQETYDYLYGKEHRGIYGIKGDHLGRKGYVLRTSTVNKIRGKPVKLIWLGVNDLKEHTYDALDKKEGEYGYCLYPTDPSRGYDLEYFKGLYSEKKIITVNKRGHKQIYWEKVRKRNEPLDVRNYSRAAYIQLAPNLDDLEKDRDHKGKKVKKKVTIFKRR